MTDKTLEYSSDAVRVSYHVARCIHAAECVKRLPGVFDANRRPWINPSDGSADEIAEAIHACPTGALTYERLDGGASEAPSTTNRITLGPDGPLYVRGNVSVLTKTGEEIFRGTRVALCRCGASTHKPFCDGKHEQAGFKDTGAIEKAPRPADDPGPGTLAITVMPNGPLIMKGPYTIVADDGAEADCAVRGTLCRCGASHSKPMCDATHGKIGFQD